MNDDENYTYTPQKEEAPIKQETKIEKTGRALETAGAAEQAAGRTMQAVGKSAQAAGTTMEAAGKSTEVAGKGTQIAGKGVKAAGQGVSSAGHGMMEAGVGLSATGVGAIAGVPLAVLGGVTTAVGKTAEVAGTGAEVVGKETEKAGKKVTEAGKKTKEYGKKIDDKGKEIVQHGKELENQGKNIRQNGVNGLAGNPIGENNNNHNKRDILNRPRRNKDKDMKPKGKHKKRFLPRKNKEATSTSDDAPIANDKSKKKLGLLPSKDAIIKIPLAVKVIALAAIFTVVFLILTFLFIITNIYDFIDVVTDSGSGGGGGPNGTKYAPYQLKRLATAGYHALNCPEMTVIKDGSTVGTYSAKDYVAGVVYAEVGGFRNLEVYKTFAVSARTYGETHHDGNCTIAGDATRQAFTDITNDNSEWARLIYQAVEETEGIVILEGNNVYTHGEYDAFCFTEKNINTRNYVLSQKNQQIPINWVNDHIHNGYYKDCPCDANDASMSYCWKDGRWQDGGHGRGMSQYGALYLATEENYDYRQILSYYYDGISLSMNSFTSTVGNLKIKDTTNATELHENLSSYLSSKGSSISDLNNYVSTNVNNNGYKTRAGVVTAAVSLINYLYDNTNVRIPYYWGGSYQNQGVNPSFGQSTHCSTTPGGNVYCYSGFDCSGFVSWAIKNGGFDISRHNTKGFQSDYGSDSCSITDSSCVGQPGDLINSSGCHVQLIVSVDKSSNRYYVAESTGSHGLITRAWNMHSPNCGNVAETRIIHMNSLYGD